MKRTEKLFGSPRTVTLLIVLTFAMPHSRYGYPLLVETVKYRKWRHHAKQWEKRGPYAVIRIR